MACFRRLPIVLAVLVVARFGRAEPPRIATLEEDPALAHSISVALSSWQANVVHVQAERPGPDMNEAVVAARKIARDANAHALLWIGRGTGGCSLWIYDPRTNEITVRPLADCPPYDDAASAAVALSAKTALRDVLASTAPTAETAPPSAAPTTAPTTTTTTTAAPPPAPAPRKHTGRVEAYVAGRIPTHADDPVAARFGLEASYFPAWFRGYAGIAASFDAGPSVTVTRPDVFSGTFSDVSASFMVRGRVPLREWLSLEVGLGPGFHVTALEGSSPGGDVMGRVERVNPSVDAMIGAEASWRWLRAGPILGVSFLTQSQRYHVGTDLVLDVPVAQAQLGFRIGVELP